MTSTQMNDLRYLLPQSDKKLWVELREGRLTINQFKARIDAKQKRAQYKVLEDLLDEGLHPELVTNLEDMEKLLKQVKQGVHSPDVL